MRNPPGSSKLFDNHRPPSSFITRQIYTCHPVTDELQAGPIAAGRGLWILRLPGSETV
jgi:hypothetical protein